MKDVDDERLAQALKAKGLHDYVWRAAELAKRANEARRMNADAYHPAQVEDFYDARGRDGYLADVAQGEALIHWIERTMTTMPAQPPEGRSLDPLNAAIDSMFHLPSDLSTAERMDLIEAIRAVRAKIVNALGDPRFKLISPNKPKKGRPVKDFDLQLLVAVAYRFIHPEGQHTPFGDQRSIQPIIQLTLALCESLNMNPDEDQVKYRLNIIYKKIESNEKNDKDTRPLALNDINHAIFDPTEFFQY